MKSFRCYFILFFLHISLKVHSSTGLSLDFSFHTFSVGNSSGLQVVQFRYLHLLQPFLCNVCRMWFCIVLLRQCMEVPKKILMNFSA